MQLKRGECKMQKMWTVSYQEYLKFDGVKDGIKNVKARKKVQRRLLSSMKYGEAIEQTVFTVLSKHEQLKVSHTAPQMDIGFGADFQVSFKENEKNYSFFLDVTCSKKPNVKYLTLKGNTTEDWNSAFCYQADSFRVYFGLKERHSKFFFYEKPVVVMSIDEFEPGKDIGEAHVNNIGQILMSLNNLLKERGCGARASQKIQPNPTIFRDEFKRSL